MKMTCQTQMIFQVTNFFKKFSDNNGNDGNNTSNKGNLVFLIFRKAKEKEDQKMNMKEDPLGVIPVGNLIFPSLR